MPGSLVGEVLSFIDTDMTDPTAPLPEPNVLTTGARNRKRLPGWRAEALRTTFWLVPCLLILVAVLCFGITFSIDLAAYEHHLTLPFWVRAVNANAGRQILIAIAAAVITVIGVVFSITILALTLASQQFGPRMMRTFMRDLGNQLTLGIFVGTFVYSVLTLGFITTTTHTNFVPHLSITVAEALLLVDLGVLIYFIHHIATSIQLPEVIARIAEDLLTAIDTEYPLESGTEEPGVRGRAGAEVGRARYGCPRGIERVPAVRRVGPAGRHRVARGRRHPPHAPAGALHSGWAPDRHGVARWRGQAGT